MNYAIEESVVDAFVQYLNTVIGSEMTIYAAPTTDKEQYPCVAVRAAEVNPVRAGASWNDSVKVRVELLICTQAADELDTDGKTVTTARMRNAKARMSVLNALTKSDSSTAPDGISALSQAIDRPYGLAAWLSAQQIAGLWVKSAVPDSPLARMDIDAENRLFTTVINVVVIAQAVEV